jgi:molecular chaperone DnaK (HSP70)
VPLCCAAALCGCAVRLRRLGGDDFDEAIACHLIDSSSGVRGGSDRSELRVAARRLKEQLTVSKLASLEWGGEAGRVSGAAPASLSLSRQQLETACAPLLERLREPVIRACAQAQVALPGAYTGAAARAAMKGARPAQLARPSLRGQQLARVLRVGAASRMPAVGRMLEALVGFPCPVGSVRPEVRTPRLTPWTDSQAGAGLVRWSSPDLT